MDGRCHLRVIMSLIPSNSVMVQLSGCVQELPGITQYNLSVTLGEQESLKLCQSDMTSAFYLFSLPRQWKPFLAFNLIVDGSDIGRRTGVKFALACGVLPMGWASAVSVLQEVSQELVMRHGLPRDLLVTRTRPLPAWLCGVLDGSGSTQRPWFHVYLDNFFAGQRSSTTGHEGLAEEVHAKAEAAWASAVNAEEVQELGALMDGKV